MMSTPKKRKLRPEAVQYSQAYLDRLAKPKLFFCDECVNDGYADLNGLKVHKKRKHSTEPKLKCERGCDMEFDFPSDLKKHYNSKKHDNIRDQICTFVKENGKVCGEAFSQKGELNDHMRKHTGNMFKCNQCSMKCSTRGNLEMHMARRHGQKQPTFFCSVEGCAAAPVHTQSELTRHMMTHAREFPFICERCGYASNQKNNLLRHQTWCGSEQQRQSESKTEAKVAEALRVACIGFEWNTFFVRTPMASLVGESGRQHARIDFNLPVSSGNSDSGSNIMLFLEVDEHQHYDTVHNDPWYSVECEQARMLDVQQSLVLDATRAGKEPPKVVWIRYNPDAFSIDGLRVRVSTKERLASLVEVIRSLTSTPERISPGLSLVYMFYDVDSNTGRLRIERDTDFHPSMSACIARIVSSSLVAPAASTLAVSTASTSATTATPCASE